MDEHDRIRARSRLNGYISGIETKWRTWDRKDLNVVREEGEMEDIEG